MKDRTLRWETVNKSTKTKSQHRNLGTEKTAEEIVSLLLKNRGINTKKEAVEFFNPTSPENLSLKDLKIDKKNVDKAILRLKDALLREEKVIVYGDYDADGVCGTAIVWETLNSFGIKALPYLPERFSEGYGLNAQSLVKLKKDHPDLGVVISVDNGIVAGDAVKKAGKLGVDVIITDHHQPGETYPDAYAIIHTTEISGSAVAWIFSRELKNQLAGQEKKSVTDSLELAAIGTIADQLPLLGANRSFAKFGLESLNKTERVGLLSLFNEAGIVKGSLGTYEVNFIIAPRINAMGRMEHAMDSLRLVCTNDKLKADQLAGHIAKTNNLRQEVVEKLVIHARDAVNRNPGKKVIILSHESYHEGVIGLAASRLVEEYYCPCIVISTKGEIAKASARSISGFNIIEEIRKHSDLLIAGGGHPMAAGFSISAKDVDTFIKRFEEGTRDTLTDELLTKRLKVDMEIKLKDISRDLLGLIMKFAPFGLGNPNPVFVSRKVEIGDARVVGKEGKHLKLSLATDFEDLGAIAFGFGHLLGKLNRGEKADIAYSLEENVWNGKSSLQLKIKDIKLEE